MGLDADIKEFCYKFEARVGPSHRRWRRAKPIPYPLHENSTAMYQPFEFDEIPLVEIVMPEDRFRALLDHGKWLEKIDNKSGFFVNDLSRVKTIVDNHEHESRLRHQHPALQKAWENYCIILGMVDDGKTF